MVFSRNKALGGREDVDVSREQEWSFFNQELWKPGRGALTLRYICRQIKQRKKIYKKVYCSQIRSCFVKVWHHLAYVTSSDLKDWCLSTMQWQYIQHILCFSGLKPAELVGYGHMICYVPQLHMHQHIFANPVLWKEI